MLLDMACLALSLKLAEYRPIRRQRIVAVWGPPGTGKTHFLAVVILGLLVRQAIALT